MNLKEQLVAAKKEQPALIIQAGNEANPLMNPKAEIPYEPQYRVTVAPYTLREGSIALKPNKMKVYLPKTAEEKALLDFHVARGNIAFN